MIDNRTSNKNYPLPHPENIASQDVGRIAAAIEMIDGDVNACDEAIESLENTVSALDERSLRIPQDLVGIVDTELQDLEPNRYIVVNAEGTGFSTIRRKQHELPHETVTESWGSFKTNRWTPDIHRKYDWKISFWESVRDKIH